ncbi:MAG: hypothetical protein ACLPX7_23585 [Xanthobacteraceae bacterium]
MNAAPRGLLPTARTAKVRRLARATLKKPLDVSPPDCEARAYSATVVIGELDFVVARPDVI